MRSQITGVARRGIVFVRDEDFSAMFIIKRCDHLAAGENRFNDVTRERRREIYMTVSACEVHFIGSLKRNPLEYVQE